MIGKIMKGIAGFYYVGVADPESMNVKQREYSEKIK